VCVNQHVKLYFLYTVELGYKVMKGAAFFCVLVNECHCNRGVYVMVNSEELFGTTECLTLYTRFFYWCTVHVVIIIAFIPTHAHIYTLKH
jgi:hypothetical protein